MLTPLGNPTGNPLAERLALTAGCMCAVSAGETGCMHALSSASTRTERRRCPTPCLAGCTEPNQLAESNRTDGLGAPGHYFTTGTVLGGEQLAQCFPLKAPGAGGA